MSRGRRGRGGRSRQGGGSRSRQGGGSRSRQGGGSRSRQGGVGRGRVRGVGRGGLRCVGRGRPWGVGRSGPGGVGRSGPGSFGSGGPGCGRRITPMRRVGIQEGIALRIIRRPLLGIVISRLLRRYCSQQGDEEEAGKPKGYEAWGQPPGFGRGTIDRLSCPVDCLAPMPTLKTLAEVHGRDVSLL